MGPRFHFFTALLASGLIYSAAQAQMRDRAPAPQPSAAAVPAAPRSTAPAGGAPTSAASGSATRAPSNRENGGTRIASGGHRISRTAPVADPVSSDAFQDVPGLGFDFPHLAAIARAQGRSTHFGHNEHNGQGFFTPIFFGGYPYYADDFGMEQPAPPAVQDAEQQPQPQPQILVIQQPAPSLQAADSGNGIERSDAAAPAVSPEAAIPDRGNFVLVRRDGRVFFASLFSVVGTQLQYITPEGIRRTLPMAELDADATEQMNEARGTSIQIRN
jgi:hypothetical protein